MKMTRWMIAAGMLAMTLAAVRIPAAPPSPDYVLLYADEFEGNAVNEQDWGYRTGRRTGGTINGLNLKENVTVSSGALHIAVRQEMIGGKLENTGGGLISRHQFGYGYYETLSRPFMAGRGVHSSFWQSGGARPNNNIFEIDAYEIDSTSKMGCNNLYVHIAPKGFKEVPWPCRANVPFSLQPGGWFLDGYEYTPEGVTFYDNGRVVARAEWDELTAAQAVWLSGLNGCGKVDGGKMPGETTFDYFRYYAKDYPGVNLLPNGNFEYNQDKVNPSKPVAWQQEGTAEAGMVVEGNAARDHYKLRHGKEGSPYEITTRQSLEYIMNGDYELSAMVRSSGGQAVAQMRVEVFGGQALAIDIPTSEQWIRIAIPRVPVTNHSAAIAITSKGEGGQWLEVDDVRFLKPLPAGQPAPAPRPFVLVGDPLWHLAKKEPIEFSGDDKFYFFDRCVGLGEAITVSFVMTPKVMANMSPIARIPREGRSGWAVQLAEDGGVIFRIGSGANHRDVTASRAYEAGKPCRVTCVFDKGTAMIYVDGRLLKSESGITQDTQDATAAGRLGTVGETYQAVGDVIVRTESAPDPKAARSKRSRNYAGTLRDVRVYNRALSAQEVDGLEKTAAQQPFQPSWPSLERYRVPAWFRDAKFGIFVHWGPQTLAGAKDGSADGSKTQNWTDYATRFAGEKFDAGHWAELFQKSGAKYVVMVAEHHDGYALYDSSLTSWTSVKRAPRRDFIAETAAAVRGRGLVFGASSHTEEYWWFYSNPPRKTPPAPLPGRPVAPQPDKAFLDWWLARQIEIIDHYRPQVLWFDWCIEQPGFEPYLRRLAAYYYNRAAEWGEGVVLNYKYQAIPEKAAVLDISWNTSRFSWSPERIQPTPWQFDTMSNRSYWFWREGMEMRPLAEMIAELADVVSKNGNYLLNFPPAPDGRFTPGQEKALLGIGEWLEVNGEAIYGTRPWKIFGEGPVEGLGPKFQGNPPRTPYTAQDIRFTAKGDVLYAIVLAWPADRKVTVRSLAAGTGLLDHEIRAVHLLGSRGGVIWKRSAEGLQIELPAGRSGDAACVLKIE